MIGSNWVHAAISPLVLWCGMDHLLQSRYNKCLYFCACRAHNRTNIYLMFVGTRSCVQGVEFESNKREAETAQRHRFFCVTMRLISCRFALVLDSSMELANLQLKSGFSHCTLEKNPPLKSGAPLFVNCFIIQALTIPNPFSRNKFISFMVKRFLFWHWTKNIMSWWIQKTFLRSN